MAIVLGPNQYGKSENRVVRVYRHGDRHDIRDLNVSSQLRGDFADAHVTGVQSDVLPTDTQKNTIFALAKKEGIGAVEDFAIAVAEHLIAHTPMASGARVEIEEYAWDRILVDGVGHAHSFSRRGDFVRTTVVNVEGRGADRRVHVISGLKDLVLAKTTGSEFFGFLKDEYTTLPETHDRILATSLVARWRYDHGNVDWDKSFDAVKALLLEQFAQVHSYALQQTLYAMGEVVLQRHPELAEIKFSAPNKHHFLVDLSPFDLQNDNEVFIAADRPYGLIEVAVVRDDASEPGDAWLTVPGFC